MSKVFVGNLVRGETKEELEDVLGKYGKIRHAWVGRDPPGFGFVEFDDERDALDAVDRMQGNKQAWNIEMAKKKDPRRRERGGRRDRSRDRRPRDRSRSRDRGGRGRSPSRERRGRSRSRSRSPPRRHGDSYDRRGGRRSPPPRRSPSYDRRRPRSPPRDRRRSPSPRGRSPPRQIRRFPSRSRSPKKTRDIAMEQRRSRSRSRSPVPKHDPPSKSRSRSRSRTTHDGAPPSTGGGSPRNEEPAKSATPARSGSPS